MSAACSLCFGSRSHCAECRPWEFGEAVAQHARRVTPAACAPFAGLLVCAACKAQKVRPSDGFCGGCGHKPPAHVHYVSYQQMEVAA